MIDIRVCRGGSSVSECLDGDPLLNWGPDISDALLTTDEAARERGRVEIDKSFSNRNKVDITTFDLSWKQPGTIEQLVDINKNHIGILRNIAISISNNKGNITIEASHRIESNL